MSYPKEQKTFRKCDDHWRTKVGTDIQHFVMAPNSMSSTLTIKAICLMKHIEEELGKKISYKIFECHPRVHLLMTLNKNKNDITTYKKKPNKETSVKKIKDAKNNLLKALKSKLEQDIKIYKKNKDEKHQLLNQLNDDMIDSLTCYWAGLKHKKHNTHPKKSEYIFTKQEPKYLSY